jgi:hypothetical protein
MENIIIHPKNAEQLNMVKAILKALKIQFELRPPYASESIHRGIQQYEAGKSITLEEFTQKHLSE